MTEKLWYEKTEFTAAGKFTDGLLKRTGVFVLTAPNIITMAGALAVVPMCMAYRAGAVWTGLLLFAFGLLTDWLDGALARYQVRHMPNVVADDVARGRSEWFRIGPTELGKKLDPVVDKLRYYGALFPLGWSLLPHALVWVSFVFALALTVFRPLVAWRWGLKPAANAVGKIKVYVEAGTIACMTFVAAGVPTHLILFGAATALGGASLLTQAQSILRQRKSRNP